MYHFIGHYLWLKRNIFRVNLTHIISSQMPEIRIVLTEDEYQDALQGKGLRVWREILLGSLGLEPEKRRPRHRPRKAEQSGRLE